MVRQKTIFDSDAGEKLKDSGIKMAGEYADRVRAQWRADCWKLFYYWLNRKPRYYEFMVETFRKYVEDYDLLELPPSNRAFAFIAKKAVKEGMIKFGGNKKVSNKKAHACFASCWVKL